MKKIPLFLVLFLAGCTTTTIITRSAHQKYDAGTDKKKIIDAITYTISENGFEVTMLNESYGMVNTNWRKVSSELDNTRNVLSAIGSIQDGRSSSYSRALSLSFSIKDDGYSVTPKLKKITTTKSYFSSGSTDEIEYPKQDSSEGKLTMKIIQEINAILGIQDDIAWTEKEITVGEE